MDINLVYTLISLYFIHKHRDFVTEKVISAVQNCCTRFFDNDALRRHCYVIATASYTNGTDVNSLNNLVRTWAYLLTEDEAHDILVAIQGYPSTRDCRRDLRKLFY